MGGGNSNEVMIGMTPDEGEGDQSSYVVIGMAQSDRLAWGDAGRSCEVVIGIAQSEGGWGERRGEY